MSNSEGGTSCNAHANEGASEMSASEGGTSCNAHANEGESDAVAAEATSEDRLPGNMAATNDGVPEEEGQTPAFGSPCAFLKTLGLCQIALLTLVGVLVKAQQDTWRE